MRSGLTVSHATAPSYFTYATHNQQGGGLVSSQGTTATGPWNKTYQKLAGRTLKSTFDDGTTEIALQTNTYDTFGRLYSTKDADNVTQLVAYNAKGEAIRDYLQGNKRRPPFDQSLPP